MEKEYLILILVKIGMLITVNYFFTGQCLNQSLLVTTLAQRIAAGDIELVEKGDSIGKKEYYEKLLKSVEKDFINFG